MEDKIHFPMLLGSYTLTDGGAVTPVVIFLREVLAVNGFLWDRYCSTSCVFFTSLAILASVASGIFVLLTCAVLHISELLH